MTLEAYLKAECAKGTIDLIFRAHVREDGVAIDIHPIGRQGMTAPTLYVDGDTVSTAKRD